MSSRKNDGSELQDKLRKALESFAERHRAFWHRFPDTKSARVNYLKAQPGDFMLVTPPGAILIECKSTETSTRLISMAHHGDTGKNQLAKHRLWMRAGQPAVYLWCDLRLQWVEWHWSKNVVQKVDKPFLVCGLSCLEDSLTNLVDLIAQEHTREAAV